jgi:hypothetical protein
MLQSMVKADRQLDLNDDFENEEVGAWHNAWRVGGI